MNSAGFMSVFFLAKKVMVSSRLKDHWCSFTFNTLHAVMKLTAANYIFILIRLTVIQKISVTTFFMKVRRFKVCCCVYLFLL